MALSLPKEAQGAGAHDIFVVLIHDDGNLASAAVLAVVLGLQWAGRGRDLMSARPWA
jgi:hypothetical protein